MAKHWIANAVKNKGALHSHLGVPVGEKIPEDKLRAATHSKNTKIKREANLAMTLKGLNHKKSMHHDLGKNVMSKLYGSK